MRKFKKHRDFIFIMLAALAVSAFSIQPLNERLAQKNLPIATGDIWQKLAKCKVGVDEKKGIYFITNTPEVKALAGKEITVQGFMLPLESTAKHSHFLLSKRTPTCPYCMPGEPNEIFEVYAKTPVEYTDGMLNITGTLELMNDPSKGLFFKLAKARGSVLTVPKMENKNKPV